MGYGSARCGAAVQLVDRSPASSVQAATDTAEVPTSSTGVAADPCFRSPERPDRQTSAARVEGMLVLIVVAMWCGVAGLAVAVVASVRNRLDGSPTCGEQAAPKR